MKIVPEFMFTQMAETMMTNNLTPTSPVEILPNLTKIQRNSQYSLFCAKFYEEFNGGSCQSLGKKRYEQKCRGGILRKIQYCTGSLQMLEYYN